MSEETTGRKKRNRCLSNRFDVIFYSIVERMGTNYVYMDESTIDDELKCPICTQPFEEPVSLSCQHTFCHQCIQIWLEENRSCPTCRECPDSSEDQQIIYSPINTHIVNNQLDRLLVRCHQCEQENIQRGNLSDHQDKCLKRIVSCQSADIHCSWTGLREERDQHSQQCSFEQLRPIIDSLQKQLQISQETQNEFREQIEIQSNQMNFLLAFINGGNSMNRECVKPYGKCQLTSRNQSKSRFNCHCTLCHNRIRRRFVVLHACSVNETIDCICQSCYQKQYPIHSETDQHDEE